MMLGRQHHDVKPYRFASSARDKASGVGFGRRFVSRSAVRLLAAQLLSRRFRKLVTLPFPEATLQHHSRSLPVIHRDTARATSILQWHDTDNLGRFRLNNVEFAPAIADLVKRIPCSNRSPICSTSPGRSAWVDVGAVLSIDSQSTDDS